MNIGTVTHTYEEKPNLDLGQNDIFLSIPI